MMLFHNIRRFALTTLLISCGIAGYSDFACASGSPKSEHERRMEEHRRKMEEHRKRFGQSSTSKSPPVSSKFRSVKVTNNSFKARAAAQKSAKDTVQVRRSLTPTTTVKKTQVEPSQVTGTPLRSPDDQLKLYIAAAKRATSYESLLPYLPEEDRERHERKVAGYDPQTAKERRERMIEEGEVDRAGIEHLTSAPGVFLLKHNKSMASKIKRITNVRVNGTKAMISAEIRSSAVIDGFAYSKGTATIGMVLEGRTWRFQTFKEGVMVSR